MADDHQPFIRTPRQLITVVVLAFLVPIVVITLIARFVSTTTRTGAGADSMSAKAIEDRLKPVAHLVFEGQKEQPIEPAGIAPAQAAAAQGAAASASPAAAPVASPATATAAAGASGGAAANGESVYQGTCHVCHGTGVAGAPKFADAGAWKPRIEQGLDTLKKHAIDGIRAMPPRGGNATLSDAQVDAAVDYMVNAAK